MAAPVPPSLEQLGERPFSFYPAIIGVDHNEWAFRKATWSELLVVNRTTKQEVWIPRRYLGEVSRIDEPVVIIGLVKELEFKGGMVIPHERRVIEISRAVNDIPRPLESVPVGARPAPVVGIRLEPGAESKVGRMLLTVIAVSILLCIGVVAVMSWGSRRVVYQPVVQSDLGFNTNDDYFSVVNKLGPPGEDKWRSDQGQLQYRRLSYPQPGVSIILMGSDRKDMHYVGAMDRDWHVVHSINRNSEAMLRGLRRF
jgi:hypothetical protein